MDNFQFYSPTEFIFGKETEAQAGEMVKKYGGKKGAPPLRRKVSS